MEASALIECAHPVTMGLALETFEIRDAKTQLSAIVAAAERGCPSVITRDGRPSAMVVSVEAGRRLYPENTPSFADHLLAFTGPLDIEPEATRGLPSWKRPFAPVQLPAGVTLSQAVLDERGESEDS